MLEDNEVEQHAPQDPKNTLLKIEFDAIRSKFCKGQLKIGNEVVGPFGFDHDVVNVSLNLRYRDVAERSKGGDKRYRELVRLFHRDLMVPGVRIKEVEGFAPRGRVDY